jgi:hypothetical protein
MLHVEREAASPPHLVAFDGGRSEDTARLAGLRAFVPVLLVLAATALTIVVDLVDAVPAWSHYAAAVSALVLAVHALLTRG